MVVCRSALCIRVGYCGDGGGSVGGGGGIPAPCCVVCPCRASTRHTQRQPTSRSYRIRSHISTNTHAQQPRKTESRSVKVKLPNTVMPYAHVTDNSGASGCDAVSVTFTKPTGSWTSECLAHAGWLRTFRCQSTSVRPAAKWTCARTSWGGTSTTMSGGQRNTGD